MMSLQQRLKEKLARRQAENLYRRRQVLESAQGVEVVVDGKTALNFSSNDYLGLAAHPDVVNALVEGARQWGVGSGAAHLVTGHSTPHHALEEELAAFTGRPRAILFSTGYMANLGVATALLGRSDSIFEDRLNHASLIDAGILSRAHFKRYPHGNVDDLRQQLAVAKGEKLVVSDGVFSMDGDMAPLDKMARLCAENDAWLMVDDAHGLGVLGAKGKGSIEHFGLATESVPVLMGTLGKAFGTFGAFVAGDETLIESLIQFSRSYVYTTALPPAVAEATRVSLALVEKENWRREKLTTLVKRFRRGAEQLGLTLMASSTPIQPLLLGDADSAIAVSQQLREQGFLISAIRPPTVPQGSARLRITFSALHEEHQVDALLDALEQSGVAQ